MTLLLGLMPGVSFCQETVEWLGLQDRRITSLSIYPGVIAVGTEDKGVFWQYQPSPSDTGWKHLDLGVAVRAVYAHKSGPIGWAISAGVAPAEGDTTFIYCSYMGGPFEAKSDGIRSSLTRSISDIDGFPDPTVCGETFAAGDRVLYKREFTESTWTPVYTTTIEGAFQTVRARDQYPGVVLAGGSEGFSGFFLVKSLDYGEHWEDISPFGTVYDVDFGGDNAEVIFAATFNRIYRSTDGGENWEPVLDDQGMSRLTEVLYDPAATSVFAAGDDGAGAPVLFFSRDDGDRWNSFPLTMSGAIVDMEFSHDGWIYFATPDDGVFRVRQDIVNTDTETETGAPKTFSLTQNYPNPFNETTTILYQVPEATYVDMTVYNSLGQEMAHLVSRYHLPGTYSVEWNASAVNSGLYFYKMSASGQNQVRNMVVLK